MAAEPRLTDTGTVSIHLGTAEGRAPGDSLLPPRSLLLYLETEQTRLSAHETRYVFTTNPPNATKHSEHRQDEGDYFVFVYI